MSKRANEPAMPAHGTMGEVVAHGLTLREHFAGLAMQGLLANGLKGSDTARSAVWYADALLAELERTP